MSAVPIVPGTFPEHEVRDIRPARSSWWPQDFESVLDGSWVSPQPTIGIRQDGVGLFYPGKDHTIASESEGGKTWLACLASIDEIQRGEHVIYIDFEGDAGSLVNRLLNMGAKAPDLRERFHYIRPSAQLNKDDLAEAVHAYKPSLVILDGITEAMTLQGLDPLVNAEVATFGQMLPKRLMQLGPAVVSLDHVTKSTEGRGRHAIGAVHKLNGLDGAAYLLDNVSPFGAGLTGKSKICIAKDRHGQLRRHGLPGGRDGMHWFGDLVVKLEDGFAEVSVEAPHERDPDWQPTAVMTKIANTLKAKGPLAQRVILSIVKGNKATAVDALNLLIADGYVSNKTPHALLKDYPA